MTQEQRNHFMEVFQDFSTGLICDAMDKLKLKKKVIHGLTPISPTQPRMTGFAYTVRQIAIHHDPAEGLLVKHAPAIDAYSQSGDVMVIDVGGHPEMCSGGAILALRGKMRGLRGYVIDGAYRDIEECREIGMPIFVKSTSPVRSHNELETVALNEPVEIRGVQVRPGDFLVADQTGIVVIPEKHLEAIEKECTSNKAHEDAMMELIAKGYSLPQVDEMLAK